ncbi:MAG: PAS domain S-box protein [Candidatus Hydrogenedentes bacterium]|nr:PAS domain S-box protein [Candidatus Hydrogenedentota bacterium]
MNTTGVDRVSRSFDQKGGNESSSKRKIRLLLVDDNPDTLVSLEATLQGLADELLMAGSGAEALRHVLEDDDFAAILLDVKMPEMDGFETAELIRSRWRNRHTPILFLTGYRSDAQLFRGYDLGAVDFLFKPIVPEILRSKVSVFVELARNTQLLREQTEVLTKAEQKFRSLLEAAPDATVITHADGEITLVNSRTLELFGYERGRLLGHQITILVPAWPFSNEFARSSAAVLAANRETAQLVGVRRDGTTFPVELSVSPLETKEGVLITTVIRDITERREAESKIMSLNSELERRVAERTAELLRSNEALRQFAWAASHDLQEPLRMVISFSQMLSREQPDLSQRSREFLGIVQSGALRMNELLAALRQYMQASEAGQYERQVVDSNLALCKAIALLPEAIQQSGARMHCGDLPAVMGVEVLLIQVFQNLIGNGIKYRREDTPEIEITGEIKGRECIITVRDNGIGVEAPYQERIFGVFRRLHPNRYPGTGIGLAICKTAVERMGGRIWVESQPGVGSSFKFSLPAAG